MDDMKRASFLRRLEGRIEAENWFLLAIAACLVFWAAVAVLVFA